jgi:hypothetical protein
MFTSLCRKVLTRSRIRSQIRIRTVYSVFYTAKSGSGSTKCKIVHKNTTNLGFFSFWCISKRKMLLCSSYKNYIFRYLKEDCCGNWRRRGPGYRGGGGLIAPFPGAGKMIINDVLRQLGDPRFNFCKLNQPVFHLMQVRLWFGWIVI